MWNEDGGTISEIEIKDGADVAVRLMSNDNNASTRFRCRRSAMPTTMAELTATTIS